MSRWPSRTPGVAKSATLTPTPGGRQTATNLDVSVPSLQEASPDYAAAKAKQSELQAELATLQKQIIDDRNPPVAAEVVSEKKGLIRALLGRFADSPTSEDDIRVRVSRDESAAALGGLERQHEELTEAVRAMTPRPTQLKAYAERKVADEVLPTFDLLLADYARAAMARRAIGNEIMVLMSACDSKDVNIPARLPQYAFTSDLRAGWRAADSGLKDFVRGMVRQGLISEDEVPARLFEEAPQGVTVRTTSRPDLFPRISRRLRSTSVDACDAQAIRFGHHVPATAARGAAPTVSGRPIRSDAHGSARPPGEAASHTACGGPARRRDRFPAFLPEQPGGAALCPQAHHLKPHSIRHWGNNMAGSSFIGSLRVDLGLSLAQFAAALCAAVSQKMMAGRSALP